MENLTNAERELVALDAALGSNCVPCIEYHIPARRVRPDSAIGGSMRRYAWLIERLVAA